MEELGEGIEDERMVLFGTELGNVEDCWVSIFRRTGVEVDLGSDLVDGARGVHDGGLGGTPQLADVVCRPG